SNERNTCMRPLEKDNVDRYVVPDTRSPASTGFPASPSALVGSEPLSIHDAPLVVERAKPVAWRLVTETAPVSLNAEMTLVPDPSTSVVLLCVSLDVVSAAGLFTIGSAIAVCGPGAIGLLADGPLSS